jgi:D-glucuronyl C5-epimerase C-terminus
MASAAKVILMDQRGHATIRDDLFLRPGGLTPAPNSRAASAISATASRSSPRTVRSVLADLRRKHQITTAAYRHYTADVNGALKEVKRLSGARGNELDAVIENLHGMAVRGWLTASRLPVLFLTLDRNVQYWKSGPALSYGQRVEFTGSELVWEYYPGQGIELQQLGSFGKAQWLCSAGQSFAARCRGMLGELVPLAVRRGGGLTWEYYFNFDGGAPPWTSAMSQGTALQALADAYKELGDKRYLVVAHRALPVFSRPPATGVGVKTYLGMRYVEYSFAASRGEEVINAFLQTLIGLDDYAQVSGDPVAQRLFDEGDAEAQAELPHFNTGAWSLYRPGVEDDLSYHQLVTGFLVQLCSMTKTPIYCRTADDFQLDLKMPAKLKLVTTRLKARRAANVYFTVSKISRVGITITRNGRTVFLTSASFAHGEHHFAVPRLKASGTYGVLLDATDLAGNYSQVSTPLHITH